MINNDNNKQQHHQQHTEHDQVMVDDNDDESNESYYLTDPEMPELITDESDFELEQQRCQENVSDLESEFEYDFDHLNILRENNLSFSNRDTYKFNARRSNQFPSNLDRNKTPSVYTSLQQQQKVDSEHKPDYNYNNNGLFDKDANIIIITGNDDPNTVSILFTNTI